MISLKMFNWNNGIVGNWKRQLPDFLRIHNISTFQHSILFECISNHDLRFIIIESYKILSSETINNNYGYENN